MHYCYGSSREVVMEEEVTRDDGLDSGGSHLDRYASQENEVVQAVEKVKVLLGEVMLR